MLHFWRDLQLATRTILRSPSFALLTVLTLAFGIAVNMTVVAVLDAYLLRSLPFPGGERLYDIRFSAPDQQPPKGLDKLDWPSMGAVIEHSVSWDLDMFYMVGGEHAESAPGAWVTPGFMAGLGIRPRLGRGFDSVDFQVGGPHVALISHSLWQRRFGGDPSILGRRFSAYVSDRPDEAELFTVIGVLPPDFWHINRFTEILAPLRVPNTPYMVRLQRGITAAEAETRIRDFVRGAITSLPEDWRPRLASTQAQYSSRVRPVLVAAAWAAGVVLLMACANAAFLLVVRAAGRQKEVGIRIALGASRGRIAMMLAAEALVLGAAATLAAFGLVSLSLDSLAPVVEQQLGRPVPGGVHAIALSGSSLGAAGASLLFAFLLGLLPVFTAARRDLTWSARSGNRSITGGRGSARLRHSLIALEVAGSVALMAAAGLMIRTTWNLLETDLGFASERVLTGQIGLRQRAYPDESSRVAFAARLLLKLREMPGVRAAAVSGGYAVQPPPVQRVKSGQIETDAGIQRVSAGYFDALTTRLLAGRSFNDGDRLDSQPVAVVSETLARKLAAEPRQAIGREVDLASEAPGGQLAAASGVRTIVGVVADVRQSVRDEDVADVYLPVLQAPGRFFSLYLKTEGEPSGWVAALQSALRDLDPEISLDSPRALQQLVDAEFARPRFLSVLLAALALFAGSLALLGVYGLVAFAVKQQEREVAIRLAIGAQPDRIVRLFVKQGSAVILLGTVTGLLGAAGLGRALRSQLYGLLPGDPLTLGITAGAMGIALCSRSSRPLCGPRRPIPRRCCAKSSSAGSRNAILDPNAL